MLTVYVWCLCRDAQEGCFVTVGQRVLYNPLRIR
jgi:hypothetical protein